MFKTPGSIVDNILIKEIAVCVEIAVFWPLSDSDFWLFKWKLVFPTFCIHTVILLVLCKRVIARLLILRSHLSKPFMY